MNIYLSSTLLELILLNAVLAYGAYSVIAGGAFSFAFVAFIAQGAYTGAILATDHGASIGVSLVVAPAIAVVGAFVLARPLERLSGIYLAIVTVSLTAVFQVFLVNLRDLTGGPLGIVGIPRVVELPQLVVAVALLAAAFAAVQRSTLGRAMRLMRADPLVAQSVGINVQRLRLYLFLASAAIAAVGGVLRAHYFGIVSPGDYGFGLLISLLAIVILGGVTHWSGPLVGAIVMTALPEWLRPMEQWKEVVTGLVLLAIILALPQGLTGQFPALGRALRRRRGGDDDRLADARADDERSPSLGPDLGLTPAGAEPATAEALGGNQ